jgi:hypothetical protein
MLVAERHSLRLLAEKQALRDLAVNWQAVATIASAFVNRQPPVFDCLQAPPSIGSFSPLRFFVRHGIGFITYYESFGFFLVIRCLDHGLTTTSAFALRNNSGKFSFANLSLEACSKKSAAMAGSPASSQIPPRR